MKMPAAKWMPTRKWWVATVTGVGGLLGTLASIGWDWGPELSGAAVAIVTQRAVAYLVPNDS
jgi:hypothetical protein